MGRSDKLSVQRISGTAHARTPDAEAGLDRALGAIYDTAADPAAWGNATQAIVQLLGAAEASLMVRNAGRGPYTGLMNRLPPAQAWAYGAYYHRLDVFRAHAEGAWQRARRGEAPASVIGQTIIDDTALVRTEYYADFLRPLGRRHMLGGMLGRHAPTPLGLFRPADAEPFDEAQGRLLERLLPHLQRALDLRERLETAERAAGIGVSALDGMRAAVAVVDAAMRPAFMNAAAEAALSSRRGLSFARAGGVLTAVVLEAAHPDDNAGLRRLVAEVAAGAGAGGALRLRLPEDAPGEAGPLVVLISPLPSRLAGRDPGDTARGLALIVIRDTAPAAAPAETLLASLFGLSPAEAGVAAALLGGTTLEAVARARGVGLETVRSQSRAVLRKAGVANLREFERLVAALRPA